MSRRSINAARAAENPDWREPVGAGGGVGPGQPILTPEQDNERLRDLVANLTRENERLSLLLADAARGARVRAPTQDEILAAIRSAVGLQTIAASDALPPSLPPVPPADAPAAIGKVVVLDDSRPPVGAFARSVAKKVATKPKSAKKTPRTRR